MADLRLVISILVIINSVSCEKDDYIRRKMEALNNRSKELYGTVGDDVKWDSFDLEYLMYPSKLVNGVSLHSSLTSPARRHSLLNDKLNSQPTRTQRQIEEGNQNFFFHRTKNINSKE